MTVDEILAKRRYVDRRRRVWEESYYSPKWKHRIGGILGEDYLWLTHAQMRLLIARDKHRVECKGLLGCRTHPVPVVTIQYNEDGLIIYETDYTRRTYPTLPEAMDAARELWSTRERN